MENKFLQKLQSIPAPGGNGCHTALLGAANLGVMCGYSRHEVFNEIRRFIPLGTRVVQDCEIWDAVNKAFDEIHPRKMNIREIIKGSTSVDELLRKSPVSISSDFSLHAKLLLKNIYKEEDSLFIGTKFSTHVRKCKEWLKCSALCKYPLIIPNPLTGEVGFTKNGKRSYRADSCVKGFRFAIAEFDSISIEEQVSFWLKMIGEGLPITVIIHSGGKSLHAWLPVKCKNSKEWESEIEQKLFPKYLVPLGIDGACKNESRMSRLPGHYRTEKESQQHLVYLNPNS